MIGNKASEQTTAQFRPGGPGPTCPGHIGSENFFSLLACLLATVGWLVWPVFWSLLVPQNSVTSNDQKTTQTKQPAMATRQAKQREKITEPMCPGHVGPGPPGLKMSSCLL